MQFTGDTNITYIPMINGDRFRVYTRNCHHIHYEDSAVYYVSSYSKNDNNLFRYAFEISKDKNYISRIEEEYNAFNGERFIKIPKMDYKRSIKRDASLNRLRNRIKNNRYIL